MKPSKRLLILIFVIIFTVLIAAGVVATVLGVLLTRSSTSSDSFFTGDFRILNINYNDALSTTGSAEFSQLANEIQTEIKNVYSSSKLSTQFDNSQVVEFRPGSVFVTLLLQFKRNGSTSLTAETVKNTFQQSLTQVSMSSQSGALNGFSTDLTSIRFTEISQADAKALLTSVSTTEIITSNPSTTDATDSPTTYAVTTPTTEIVTSTTRNDSSTSTCGSRPAFFNRIVGGTNSVNGEWPWQVSLQIRSHICGASIISDRWLISAAHCFRDSGSNPSIWTALIGTIDVRRGTVQTIETIIIHPLYRQTSNDYDIAVLKLSSPLIFEANIQPICLPSSDRVFNAGDSCTITGWGALEFEGSLPRILQKANVDIIDDNTCKNIYSQFTERMLCAGFLSGGVDSCQGDSGGPLACMQPDGKWFLAGIVSFGFQCARPGFPGVYARVTALRDWVQEQTGV
ncbi:transmembrane protease serine 9-like isoform X2 [Hemiscyllium ocellatum]|uniref:transmembrane protease serine 9-like isoform X2 n=1 Tax=Hemiscyllium ocellatum TaxID=170820 RepID=UPI00296685DF|nr:transmembrane protease serine 9-like isoform X2 [Hemiscyllium ocellatum]XP_060696348.1 transmembrane protease serine 9-like isoform X2 [Hemiscyllium ocellatum]